MKTFEVIIHTMYYCFTCFVITCIKVTFGPVSSLASACYIFLAGNLEKKCLKGSLESSNS